MKVSDGMIITIDKEYKKQYGVSCCDVSWINKFPDECEILFVREYGLVLGFGAFECQIMNVSNGIQPVSLSLSKKILQNISHIARH